MSEFGNCKTCGAFVSHLDNSQSMKSKDQHFEVEVPMDILLKKIIALQNTGKLYNPTATYVKNRRSLVDWMCEVGEELKFQPETIHYSVCLFDNFFSNQHIDEYLSNMEFLRNKQQE